MAPAKISEVAPPQPTPPSMPHQQKMKPLSKVMARPERGPHVVVDGIDYSQASCEQCGSGDLEDELLLCDKCDKGCCMKCLRPVLVRVPIGSGLCPETSRSFSQKKINDFFGIKKCTND